MPTDIHIPYSPTVIEVDMAAQVRCISLAPGEIDSYTWLWQKVLGTDRIATSAWEITDCGGAPSLGPVTVSASSALPGLVSTRVELTVDPLFEGCATLTLTNTIETTGGRTLKRCIEITVEHCGGCGC